MKQQLENLYKQTIATIEKAASIDELEQIRVKVLGRKGELTQILRSLGTLPQEERIETGKLSNELKDSIEEALEKRKIQLTQQHINKLIMEDWLDVTLTKPGLLQESHMPIKMVSKYLPANWKETLPSVRGGQTDLVTIPSLRPEQ